jgi:hypothetical protein
LAQNIAVRGSRSTNLFSNQRRSCTRKKLKGNRKDKNRCNVASINVTWSRWKTWYLTSVIQFSAAHMTLNEDFYCYSSIYTINWIYLLILSDNVKWLKYLYFNLWLRLIDFIKMMIQILVKFIFPLHYVCCLLPCIYRKLKKIIYKIN